MVMMGIITFIMFMFIRESCLQLHPSLALLRFLPPTQTPPFPPVGVRCHN